MDNNNTNNHGSEIIRILKSNNDLIVKLQNQLETKDKVIEIQSIENAALTAQNETWIRVSESDDTMEMSAVAKVLNYEGVGRNIMFKLLRKLQVLRGDNEPYQRYIDAGHFDVIEQEVTTDYGTLINRKTVVTQKGVDYIRKKLDEEGYKRADR